LAPLTCLAVVAVVAVAQPSDPRAGTPRRPTLAELEKRAAGLIPTKDQLRYQEIPWVHDLAEAQAVAQAERRPIFLWGYGGRGRPDNGLEGC
jgi:hypothetical protein